MLTWLNWARKPLSLALTIQPSVSCISENLQIIMAAPTLCMQKSSLASCPSTVSPRDSSSRHWHKAEPRLLVLRNLTSGKQAQSFLLQKFLQQITPGKTVRKMQHFKCTVIDQLVSFFKKLIIQYHSAVRKKRFYISQ